MDDLYYVTAHAANRARRGVSFATSTTEGKWTRPWWTLHICANAVTADRVFFLAMEVEEGINPEYTVSIIPVSEVEEFLSRRGGSRGPAPK